MIAGLWAIDTTDSHSGCQTLQFESMISVSYTGCKVYRTKDGDAHSDTIQCIEWDHNQGTKILITGSWDCTVKAWEWGTEHLGLKSKYTFQEPVLSVTMNKNYIIFAGLANGQIHAIQLSTGNIALAGKHDAAICYLKWVDEADALVSFGLDQTMNFWQIGDSGIQKTNTIMLPERTNVVDISFPFLLICSLYKFRIYRLDRGLQNNDWSSYWQSPLENCTKISACSINGGRKVFGLGTVEGTAFFNNFQDDGSTSNNNSSKIINVARKQDYGAKATLYQINSVKLVTFKETLTAVCASGDGNLSFHCPFTGSEYKKFKTRCPAVAIASGAVSGTNYIAYSVGNDWSLGLSSLEKSVIKAQLEVKQILDSDYRKA